MSRSKTFRNQSIAFLLVLGSNTSTGMICNRIVRSTGPWCLQPYDSYTSKSSFGKKKVPYWSHPRPRSLACAQHSTACNPLRCILGVASPSVRCWISTDSISTLNKKSSISSNSFQATVGDTLPHMARYRYNLPMFFFWGGVLTL